MDPQTRVLLEEGARAFAQSGRWGGMPMVLCWWLDGRLGVRARHRSWTLRRGCCWRRGCARLRRAAGGGLRCAGGWVAEASRCADRGLLEEGVRALAQSGWWGGREGEKGSTRHWSGFFPACLAVQAPPHPALPTLRPTCQNTTATTHHCNRPSSSGLLSACVGVWPTLALYPSPKYILRTPNPRSHRSSSDLLGACVGVYVGCIWTEYGEQLAAHQGQGKGGGGGGGGGGSSQVVTGNGLAFMAGRVSYTFGLTGACVGLCGGWGCGVE